MAAMKALWLAEPGKMDLVDRPKPDIRPDEVLIRVAAAAICHTDFRSISGRNPNVRMPIILGHEFSGTAEVCGEAVRLIKPGDRVAVPGILACFQCHNCWRGLTTLCLNYSELGARVDGGFAEYVAVPGRVLVPISDGFSSEEAALVEAAANGFAVARSASIEAGDSVVVIGPGAIGLLALQFARLYHPRFLILIGTREERLAIGARLGATHTINIHAQDPVEAVTEITNGTGADAVLQCAGTLSATQLAMRVTGEGGRVCIEGTSGSSEELCVNPDDLVDRALKLIGVRGWNQRDFVRALDNIETGLVDVRSLITHTFPLTEYRSAFETAELRKSDSLRVLLIP
jgi:L-iditol 2-dehydrogenase